jgi:4-hydroxybenzoate polyprenyltransferase
MITTGMFLLNDILDIELDRANGKKRPLPSGQVTKRQGWIFIIWTNAAAVALAIITGNPMTMILVLPMLAIGLMYSAPKIALDDRFVIKTLVIAIYYILCAALGFTSVYGISFAISNPMLPVYAAFVLGGMRFISSVLNDTGDVEGDRAAGRRTIPIVIGRANTVKMGAMIAIGMIGISIGFYVANGIGLVSTLLTSSFAALLGFRMAKTVKSAGDKEFIRKQHKRLLPFDLSLLSALAAGAIPI